MLFRIYSDSKVCLHIYKEQTCLLLQTNVTDTSALLLSFYDIVNKKKNIKENKKHIVLGEFQDVIDLVSCDV